MATLDIRTTSMYLPSPQGGTRAYASVTIDGCFVVRGIKVVESSKDGLFVSIPSRKSQDGYKEVCFPIAAKSREQPHSGVLDAYNQALTMAQTSATSQQATPKQETTDRQMTEM